MFMRGNFFLSQRGITLFTVSHRKSLWKHHEVRKSECVSNMSIILFLCSTFFSSMVVEHTSTRLSIPQLKNSDPKTDYNSCLSYSSIINILLLLLLLYYFGSNEYLFLHKQSKDGSSDPHCDVLAKHAINHDFRIHVNE